MLELSWEMQRLDMSEEMDGQLRNVHTLLQRWGNIMAIDMRKKLFHAPFPTLAHFVFRFLGRCAACR